MKLADEIKLNAGGPGSGRHPGDGSSNTDSKFQSAHKDLLSQGFKHVGFKDIGQGPASYEEHSYKHPDGRTAKIQTGGVIGRGTEFAHVLK